MSNEKSNKKVRILSLDGGGIRGIIPAMVMVHIEEKIQEFSKNKNARISDYFDMVVGTSTGGILGCMYLLPNNKNEPDGPSSMYPATKALKLYEKHGYSIFNDSKRRSFFGIRQLFNATDYNPKQIEFLFKKYFKELYFHDLMKPCIITTFNLKDQSTVFFNSHEQNEEKAKKRRYLLRDVARSTSAAPTYFPPAKIENYPEHPYKKLKMVNLDGGVFANNPAMCAYAEARTTDFKELKIENPKASEMMILSLGTGAQKDNSENKSSANNWGVISWAKSIPTIMMDGAQDTVNYQLRLLFETLGDDMHKNYKRIDVPGELRGFDTDVTPLYEKDMADASPENIANLKEAGRRTIEAANAPSNGEWSLDHWIEKLVEIGPTYAK
ncbi:MAG: patatin-like phospholipase family protein [Cryomorphaceae bacterium]|nr:patatin-like phospholipase family protein [Cryomorphaceae bacterium]